MMYDKGWLLLPPDMKFLIIQTAFIGDVVLATPLIEKLKHHYPGASIDMLVRKGNETLLTNHPHLRAVLVFDKKKNKYSNLWKLIGSIRLQRYDYVINVQRFFTTGLITKFSGAKTTIGFDKNPLSIFFDVTVKHTIPYKSAKSKFPLSGGTGLEKSKVHLSGGRGLDVASGVGVVHEVHRNLSLLETLTDTQFIRPKLYPSEADFHMMKKEGSYVCIAPASVWFTKQYPADRWVELINKLPANVTTYLLGAKGDIELCDYIQSRTPGKKVEILAGQLSFLESAALMQNAKMNYVNDSAPLHFASAMNAPVTAVFCSTLPSFGFGPLSDDSRIAEIDYDLYCRSCGLHGRSSCPEGHFKCSEIIIDPLLP